MSDFRNALNAAAAEITPQPWDYTAPDGTTLTVIPDGLRAAKGDAEVMIRITASHTLAAVVGIPTEAMPGLVASLKVRQPWEHVTTLDSALAVTMGDAGVVVIVTETDWDGGDRPSKTTAAIHVPDRQRLPFASALARALDVARGWED